MQTEKEKTAPYAPNGVGTEQSEKNFSSYNMITQNGENFNPFRRNFTNQRQQIEYLPPLSMTQLYDMQFKPLIPLIDDLLYPGLYILSAPSKLGKSLLMLQIAYHVAVGKELWNSKVHKCGVLYCDYENGYRTVQSRLYKMFGVEKPADNLLFITEPRQIENNEYDCGLINQLSVYLRNYLDIKLIIIDTLVNVLGNGIDDFSYARDYQKMRILKDFADSTGVCMVLVHHNRKMKTDDFQDMVSGTTGMVAAANGTFGLYRENKNIVLQLRCREQRERKIILSRDDETLLYNMEREDSPFAKEKAEPLHEKIAELVTAENPHWRGTATELLEALKLDDMANNTVTRKLNATKSRLINDYNIIYSNKRTHEGRFIEFEFIIDTD